MITQHGINLPRIPAHISDDAVRGAGFAWWRSGLSTVARLARLGVPYVFIPSDLMCGGWRADGRKASGWNNSRMEREVRERCRWAKELEAPPAAVCGLNEPDHQAFYPRSAAMSVRLESMRICNIAIREELPDVPLIGPGLSSDNPYIIADHWDALGDGQPDIVGIHLLGYRRPSTQRKIIEEVRSLTGCKRIAVTEHTTKVLTSSLWYAKAMQGLLDESGVEIHCRNDYKRNLAGIYESDGKTMTAYGLWVRGAATSLA